MLTFTNRKYKYDYIIDELINVDLMMVYIFKNIIMILWFTISPFSFSTILYLHNAEGRFTKLYNILGV